MTNKPTDSSTKLPTKPPRIPIDSRQILHGIGLLICLCFVIFVLDYHCPFKATFSIPCPGCGMTRAFLALLHGNLSLSLQWHALLIPSFFFLLLYILLWWKNIERFKKSNQWIIISWSLLMIVYWLWRVLFVFPHSPLF